MQPTTTPPVAPEHLNSLPAGATLEEIKDLIDQWINYARLVGIEDVPSNEDARSWVEALIVIRKGRAVLRKTTPRSSKHTLVHGAVHRLNQWHGGNGDLHAVYIARWEAGDQFDEVATFVQLFRIAASAPGSPALDAWKRTGLVPGGAR